MFVVFFFKQKTAYEMRISDWSSDVCSSDLPPQRHFARHRHVAADGDAGEGGDDRCHHADTGRGAVLRHRAFGQMDVDVLAGDEARLDTIAWRPRPYERDRGLAQTGRASGMERVCQYESVMVVDG